MILPRRSEEENIYHKMIDLLRRRKSMAQEGRMLKLVFPVEERRQENKKARERTSGTYLFLPRSLKGFCPHGGEKPL